MKVLILGGSGFLGSYLKKNSKKKIYFHGNNKKSFFNFDISKRINIGFLKKIKPNIIVNLISLSDVDLCQKNKKLAYRTNVITQKNIVNYCKKNNTKLIYISTDQLYNSKKGYSSEKNISILNYYSKTKFIAESLAKSCNSIILRTNFFGINKVKNVGLVNWLTESCKKKKKIDLYNNVYFSPLNVNTLSKIILKIMTSKKRGTYNLGSINKISKKDFAIQIFRKLNINTSYDEVKINKFNVKRPLDMSMNCNKFIKDFKIKLPKIENEIKKLS